MTILIAFLAGMGAGFFFTMAVIYAIRAYKRYLLGKAITYEEHCVDMDGIMRFWGEVIEEEKK